MKIAMGSDHGALNLKKQSRITWKQKVMKLSILEHIHKSLATILYTENRC